MYFNEISNELTEQIMQFLSEIKKSRTKQKGVR